MGFKQEHGVNYDEIFSPVVKMTTLRLLLGVVVTEDVELEQLDVKTTFLHGDSDEDIYMSQPAKTQIQSSARREGLQTRTWGRLSRDILCCNQDDHLLAPTSCHGDRRSRARETRRENNIPTRILG